MVAFIMKTKMKFAMGLVKKPSHISVCEEFLLEILSRDHNPSWNLNQVWVYSVHAG